MQKNIWTASWEPLISLSLLHENITKVYGKRGVLWLQELAQTVQKFALAWDLSQLQAVSNLSFNYVLKGLQGTTPVVLKLGLDLAQEAAALRCFNLYGSVALLKQAEGALLLAQAMPGTSLKHAGLSNQECLAICCQTMQRLHQAPLPVKGFPHIKQWLTKLDSDWDIPHAYLIKARQLRDQLLVSASKPVLLHGDLHRDNVLQQGVHWHIIDPKGVIGYAIHEIWPFIHNIAEDAPWVAKFTGLPQQAIIQWYFVQLILATCWNLEDNLAHDKFLKLADQTYNLL